MSRSERARRYCDVPPGNLRSPIAKLLHGLGLMTHALQNNDRVGFWGAHPLHLVEDAKAGSAQDPLSGVVPVVDYVAEADVRGDYEKTKFVRSAQDSAAFQRGVERLRATALPRMAASAASSRVDEVLVRLRRPTPSDAFNLNASVAPIEHSLELPPNRTIRPGPPLTSHPDFAETLEFILRVACATLDVPPSILSEAIATRAAGTLVLFSRFVAPDWGLQIRPPPARPSRSRRSTGRSRQTRRCSGRSSARSTARRTGMPSASLVHADLAAAKRSAVTCASPRARRASRSPRTPGRSTRRRARNRPRRTATRRRGPAPPAIPALPRKSMRNRERPPAIRTVC